MKNLFFIFLLSTIAVNAQKVALHTTSGIQHFVGVSGFNDAYNNAINGDTIYVPGGGFTAPSGIDKQLYIFGAGHYPDSTQATAKTYIIGNIHLSENADGFYLEGVEITGSIIFDYNESVNNIIVKYSKMNDFSVNGNNTFVTPSNNLTLINNVFTGTVSLANGLNAAFYNNIFNGRVYYTYGNLYENNIFLYNGSSSYRTFEGDNNIINNSIFVKNTHPIIDGISNQINNNLFVHTTASYGTTPIASGNYHGVPQTSIFINQTGNAFDYSHDYHLQSPGTYLGIDATEVGIYGGMNGYKEGAVPSNPHIQLNNISPTTNNSGFLNVHIKGTAQDK